MGDGPLMERRSDRELPQSDISGMRWARSLPIFVVVVTACTLAIFNYQKSSSSVVAATLYAARTSKAARDYLGDEIYFAAKIPWIWGEIDQMHGRIDIHYDIKGTRNRATMVFKSVRESRRAFFETVEWSLVASDGTKINLLDAEDPFKGVELDADEVKVVGRGTYSPITSS
ncbi:MAG: hypothetical protein M1818_005370 [Claussenomyces sp. TS43310]|nr:MAG: hypothetical protein M1818_005370 [Claussenomyces sp. TS43310]